MLFCGIDPFTIPHPTLTSYAWRVNSSTFDFMTVRGLVLLTLVFSFSGIHLDAQNKAQDRIQTPQSFSKQITHTVGCQYLISFPKTYDATAATNWPMILFLHGTGERGTNVWNVTGIGPSSYAARHPDFPFILVSPLCPDGQIWSNEVLLALLDEVLAKHKIDPKRVYLTGLSLGGFGAWTLGLAHPERFAALVPICAGSERMQIVVAAHGYAGGINIKQLRKLPIWVIHGAKDPIVPVEESKRMIEALKYANCNEVLLTIYPEAGHDAWTETYNNPILYNWLLKHHKQ